MNTMSMKMMMIILGMGVMGYLYLKKHPETLEKMKIEAVELMCPHCDEDYD